MRYTVDAFTPDSWGSEHPENSWSTDSAEEVGRIVHNCARKIAGICVVEVHVNEPHDEKPIAQKLGG